MDACQDLETQGQESRNREAGRNLNLRRFSVNEGAKLADYDEIKIDRLFLQPYFFFAWPFYGMQSQRPQDSAHMPSAQNVVISCRPDLT